MEMKTMKNFLSNNVSSIGYSATLDINERVRQLRAAGKNIIDLGFGEADYPAPRKVKNALHRVAKTGFSRYTNVAGTVELRKSIAEASKVYLQTNGFRTKNSNSDVYPDYNENEVIVSVGSKFLIYSAILALCNPGEEVVLHAPYWTYPDMVKVCGAKVNAVKTTQADGFELKKDILEDSLTPNSKLLIINSPNNPTGQVFSKKILKDIIDVAMEHGLFVLSDEIYGLLTYDDAEHHSISSLGDDDFLQQCIVTNGLSKAYSMGGWRIGYALIKNKQLYDAMLKISSNTVSCAPSITQDACIDFFKSRQDVTAMRKDFNNRKDIIYKRLKEIGMNVLEPKGAFYIFPDVSSFFGKKYKGKVIKNSKDFSLAMLEEGVSSLPGDPFGCENNIRICFVRPARKISEACDRIEDFVSMLK